MPHILCIKPSRSERKRLLENNGSYGPIAYIPFASTKEITSVARTILHTTNDEGRIGIFADLDLVDLEMAYRLENLPAQYANERKADGDPLYVDGFYGMLAKETIAEWRRGPEWEAHKAEVLS